MALYQPLGDKIGMIDPAGGELRVEPIDPDHGDLFFPKPFNDDQVQIMSRVDQPERFAAWQQSHRAPTVAHH
jgi:hypothetical protein